MSIDNLYLENYHTDTNYQIIAGVDEAGRGPLAGPVVAAAVIVDKNKFITGINDSKLLSSKRRDYLYDIIIANYQYSVAVISVDLIDTHNILNATKMACVQAVDSLPTNPNKIIVDGNMKFNDSRYISVVQADRKCHSVAAASIIAKVTRDRIMQELHLKFPYYGWSKNYGYGTKAHIESIKEFGRSSCHRTSFKIRSLESLL